jgi:hypothetical protein
MSYDSKCLDLATHFLADCRAVGRDREKDRDQLAQAIQTAIEDWFFSEELEAGELS